MNADRLLEHYDRIADAPDAIARLRRFILDLAVCGKLAPQEAGDEPASELLKRIAKEKVRLDRKERAKREPRNLNGEVESFQLPRGWAHAPLADLVSILNGRAYKQSELLSSGTPVLRVGNLFTSDRWYYSTLQLDEDKYCDKGDLIFAWSASFGPFIWTGEKVIYHYHIWKLPLHSEANIDKHYLYNFLLQKTREVKEAGHGISMIHMTKEKMEQIQVPLPPLAEQHRIVAKVDELMGLCDRLDAARSGREKARDRLAAASLARLNAPDPEAFRADARFALEALPALTTRPDQIKALRQTILNLAVRGKLVSQDVNDEPATELLKRIAKEKARLVKEGKAKRQNMLPEINLGQAPFELPAGWAWGRFPEVGTFGRGKSKHRPRNDPALFEGGEHLMIQTGDVARSQGVIETYTSKYNDFGLYQSFKWPKGTLCITIAANIADSGILSFDACFPDSVVGFIPAAGFENARYFEYFVRTAKANLLEFAPATAQKNINLEILTQVLIPLPPLAEQHRIVAKVDALMALCDRLEANLNSTATTRRRLFDALLAEALAPADDRELEAAE
ncbi:restriction endonuclease subunit S [Mesorhizobium neociceri]|uniref:Restriction endonuclease subunit S n=1 Tax=Mesorhizobium neociceri TaxID=1307853 RepID=A0A838B154_9HYPH|nr:restriction endonuclease subunit S [Mesorhizobium neociceri]MBA1140095.1 restriction endonuclease subunit S [Mesorhizobium neociceri]